MWNPYATRQPGGFVGKSPLGWFLRIGTLGAGIAYAGVMQGVYESLYSEEAHMNEHIKRKAGGLGVPGNAWPAPADK